MPQMARIKLGLPCWMALAAWTRMEWQPRMTSNHRDLGKNQLPCVFQLASVCRAF